MRKAMALVLGTLLSLALALTTAGYAHTEVGDSEEAIPLLAEACELARGMGNDHITAMALTSNAVAHSWDDGRRTHDLADECVPLRIMDNTARGVQFLELDLLKNPPRYVKLEVDDTWALPNALSLRKTRPEPWCLRA